jgi:hypothetical protein
MTMSLSRKWIWIGTIIATFVPLLIRSDDMAPASQLSPQIDTIHSLGSLSSTGMIITTITITVDGMNGNDNECLIDPINVACQTLNGAQRAIGEDKDDDIIISVIGSFTYSIESTGLLFQHSVVIRNREHSLSTSVIIDCSAVTSSRACLASHSSLTLTGIMITGASSVNIIQLSSMNSILTLTDMIFFNLTFHNATRDSTVACGAIQMNSSSTLVILNTIFTSIAYDLYYPIPKEISGLITILGSSRVTIMGSIFTNVTVIGNNEIIAIGSTNLPSIVSITNCWFDHNQGTIRITSHGSSPFANVLIVNTTITNQLCLQPCAESVLQLFTSNVTISSCTFFNCRDLSWKPTTDAASISILNCDFMNSKDRSAFLDFDVHAETIRSWITISSSRFNGADDGVIRLSSDAYASLVTMTIVDCCFRNNHAHDTGAAITIEGYNTIMRIMRTQFLHNWARANGGAISADSVNQITMEDCVFTNNSVVSAGGGGFYLGSIQRSSYYRRCLFQGNRAQNGGAMYIGSSGDITFGFC